ncbi:uncharacterized protein METZ01_LOCUS156404 [marine metagenome]|uniref:Uncharacterized protein n=1 Tax=marine metagenome TaxID=408172 RepID=A0A382APR3_9ZZZZ
MSFLSLWRLSAGSTDDTPVQVCVAISSCQGRQGQGQFIDWCVPVDRFRL